MNDPSPALPNRIWETLTHPLMVVSSLSMLSLYTGVIILVSYPVTIIHWPEFWGVVMIVAGVVGFVSTQCRGNRIIIVGSGALLVLAFASQSIAITEALIAGEQTPNIRRASFVAIAQWATLSYLTFLIWWRHIMPWTILNAKSKGG